jgi:cyclic 2,3-diphosphoglycerate synthetase
MRKAREREPELAVFDGSGAAIPPVEARARILVASANQDSELVTGYLNAYRILISDLVVLTMAEESTDHRAIAAAIQEINGIPVVATVLRPRPVRSIAGKRVAFFTTAPPSTADLLERHLVDEHGAREVTISHHLADRSKLRADVEGAEADLFLVEIKAAAIDVVCEAAAEREVEVVFADNAVVPLPGQPDLDVLIRGLAEAAMTPAAEAVA